MCLGIITASPALSAQIGGKALGDVDDIVKEATNGNLEIPKHSIMLLKAGEFNGSNSYLQTNMEIQRQESRHVEHHQRGQLQDIFRSSAE